MTQSEYRKYLRSDRWLGLRALAIKKQHGRCILCGATSGINVHHRSYANLGGAGEEDDLFLLCGDCHERLHKLLDGFAVGDEQQRVADRIARDTARLRGEIAAGIVLAATGGKRPADIGRAVSLARDVSKKIHGNIVHGRGEDWYHQAIEIVKRETERKK